MSYALVAALAVSSLLGCAPTFIERAAGRPGAVRLTSGSVMRTLRAGEGAVPGPSDRVKVLYQGQFVDGKIFVSARAPSEAIEIGLNAVSPCWREALSRMRIGEKAEVVCAPDSAVGQEGPKVPADTTVAFEIERIPPGASDGEEALPAGLILTTLRAGTGERPRASDSVKVHYEGRLADGKVFDSSLDRGEPAVLPLAGVIPCWRAALQKMHVGEKAKLTCPPDLAYGAAGHPPTIPPRATLTFEVELLAIER